LQSSRSRVMRRIHRSLSEHHLFFPEQALAPRNFSRADAPTLEAHNTFAKFIFLMHLIF
jgi:hypothetical protein